MKCASIKIDYTEESTDMLNITTIFYLYLKKTSSVSNVFFGDFFGPGMEWSQVSVTIMIDSCNKFTWKLSNLQFSKKKTR